MKEQVVSWRQEVLHNVEMVPHTMNINQPYLDHSDLPRLELRRVHDGEWAVVGCYTVSHVNLVECMRAYLWSM
jgi:hypothetical protein